MNKEDGNGDLMGDVTGFLCDFGGKEEERKGGGGLGVLFLGHLCSKNWDLAKGCHLNCRVLPTDLNHVWRFLRSFPE